VTHYEAIHGKSINPLVAKTAEYLGRSKDLKFKIEKQTEKRGSELP